MKDVVIFHLKRVWDGHDLWKEILLGEKTSEWRNASPFWVKYFNRHQPRRAWFVVGYPKGNMPRIEADIVEIGRPNREQFEIKFKNPQLRN
jgi:hypothetical protein